MRASRIFLLVLALITVVAKWRRTSPVTPARDEGSAAITAVSPGPARAPTAVSAREVAPPVPAVEAATPVARADDFTRYQNLARKVFATDDEVATRARLVHDADLLIEAGRVLVRRENTAALTERQNQALALLLESVRAGDPVATRALTAVIHDAAVEDVTLPRSTRENLAGLKAEAMYRWSAATPAAADQIAAALPGDVSRRLWANVTARQRANLAEGATVGTGGRVAAIPTSDDAQ